MFGNESAIALFFRFANFAVLIACGTYIFKKYVLSVVKDLIQAQKEERESLMHRKVDLGVAYKIATQALSDDAVLCKTLKSHVDTWREKANEAFALREQERKDMIILLRKKREHKEKIRAQEQVRAQVAQAVMRELHESCAHYFSQEDTGSRYLGSVIANMERELL